MDFDSEYPKKLPGRTPFLKFYRFFSSLAGRSLWWDFFDIRFGHCRNNGGLLDLRPPELLRRCWVHEQEENFDVLAYKLGGSYTRLVEIISQIKGICNQSVLLFRRDADNIYVFHGSSGEPYLLGLAISVAVKFPKWSVNKLSFDGSLYFQILNLRLGFARHRNCPSSIVGGNLLDSKTKFVVESSNLWRSSS
jgi:hypothetical protein